MTAAPTAPSEPRACGECGLCCKLMGVAAIDKPPRKWCRHFRRGAGCDIYGDRPRECAVFNCVWLLTEGLDETWRPDRCGFVMHGEDGAARLVVESDPARPHDWRREPFQSRLRAWAAATEVLVFAGDAGVRLGADGVDRPVRRAATGLSGPSGGRRPSR